MSGYLAAESRLKARRANDSARAVLNSNVFWGPCYCLHVVTDGLVGKIGP